MAIQPLHEIHRRRFGRNLGVGLALVGLVAIVFGLTVVKVTQGDPMQGFGQTMTDGMAPPATATGDAGAAP